MMSRALVSLDVEKPAKRRFSGLGGGLDVVFYYA